MNKFAALEKLLATLFTLEDLRGFIVSDENFRECEPNIAWNNSKAVVTNQLVEQFSNRGLVDEHFFGALEEVRPRRVVEIRAIAKLWGVEIGIGVTVSAGKPRAPAPAPVPAPVHIPPIAPAPAISLQVILAFVFGCLFVAILIVVAIMLPRWTPEQALVFRVVLALSAAGVGVVLPGLFEFQAQWARMGVRAGGAIGLFALVFFVTPTTPQRPDDMPPLSLANWDIRSEDKSAEGLAVDTDPLTVSWRAGGDAHDLEIWLENVQSTEASRVLRTSASQHKVTFAREDYIDVLSSRTPGTVNRVRVVANALPSGQRAVSQEFDLHVGLTVLLTADRPDVLHVSALIDDSTAALPMYAFKGTLVNMIVDERAEGRGSVSEMVADSAWFKNPMADVPLPGVKTDPKFWNNLYFIYEGPGDSRLVRTKKMFPLELTGEVLHD